jgi:hypothetical protein
LPLNFVSEKCLPLLGSWYDSFHQACEAIHLILVSHCPGFLKTQS